jgi:hypothetical protein
MSESFDLRTSFAWYNTIENQDVFKDTTGWKENTESLSRTEFWHSKLISQKEFENRANSSSTYGLLTNEIRLQPLCYDEEIKRKYPEHCGKQISFTPNDFSLKEVYEKFSK